MRKTLKKSLALLLCVVLALPLAAATPQNENIAATVGAVQTAVGKDAPGAAILIFEQGERILFEGYGYADMDDRTLVTVETSFELGRLSSLFVALAAQKLAQESKLDLEKDIAYYLPAEFASELDLTYTVCVKDLLYGCAGFADRYYDLRYVDGDLCFDNLEEALLADVPAQLAAPGSYYTYSAFGIGLAAFVVECAAGQPYATYVTEQILQPLGMNSTYLQPSEDTEILAPAAGHICTQEGVFQTAEEKGRTWSALWPADGAISNAADLSLLLQFLLRDEVGAQILSPDVKLAALESVCQNGVFQTGFAGLAVSGSARGMQSKTENFSASLCFDRATGKAALVLCNVADSALLQMPFALCQFQSGVSVTPDARELPELSLFDGDYLPAGATSGSLWMREVNAISFDTEEGALVFGEKRLVQIARGVFADAEGAGDVAVLQFLLSVEGEVLYVIDAQGNAYRPASFWEGDSVEQVLYFLLMVGAFYFFAAGVLAVGDAVSTRARENATPRPLRLTVPWAMAALHAIVVLLQLLVGTSFGAATIGSFFTAAAVVGALLSGCAAMLFVFALISAFTTRGMTARVARSAIIYVFFMILCGYWGVIIL